MSPEQIAGGSEIDVRSDIYSLGVVLHELLTGNPPSKARTVPRPLSPGLDCVLLRALEDEAQNRYPNAAELAEDVQQCIDSEPALDDPTTASLMGLWIRLSMHLLAGAVLGAVARGKLRKPGIHKKWQA